MKIPSFDELLDKSFKSFLRFPFAILFSFLTAIVAIYLIDKNQNPQENLKLVNLMLSSALGIPLFIAVKLLIEKFELNKSLKIGLNTLSILVLLLVYLSLPETQYKIITTTPYIKYAIYNIVVHLMVAFLPYIKKNEENGFWNYNKTLFLKILEAILYSGVLYVGIAVAIFAVDTLFELKVDGKIYGQIFVFLATVFNTWFFVSKIPTDFTILQNTYEYPKGLKIFTQFILLPLLLTYLVILYTYEFKIIILWDWPKGIVSYLVIAVATIGIFTFLLIYPYGNISENKWIKRFTKSYYLTLIPLVAMLYIAIIFRINDYGITINRYLLFLLGIWLLVVIIYFLIGKTNIKFIPISLAIMLVISSFGPWGMFSVSENSQLSRLDKILNKNGLIENGKIVNEVIWVKDSLPDFYSAKTKTNIDKIDSATFDNLNSIVKYLVENHDFNKLNKYFKQDIAKLISYNKSTDSYDWSSYSVYNKVIRTMGLATFYAYYSNKNNFEAQLEVNDQTYLNTDGYQKIVYFTYRNYNNLEITPFDKDNFKIENPIDSNYNLLIEVEGQDIQFDLSKLFDIKLNYDKSAPTNVDIEELTFYSTNNNYKYKLELNQLNYNSDKKITNISGYLLFGLK